MYQPAPAAYQQTPVYVTPPEYQQPPVYEQPAPPPAPAAAPPPDDMTRILAELRQLAALKEQGILTDAEFQTQKSKILGS